MINKVVLNNIQSHEDSEFNFQPGVNIIIGESHQGKSAIMRGLSWIIENNGMGKELVSHWAKNKNGNQNKGISGAIIKADRELHRIREPKANSYTLTGIEKPFTAIASDMPEQVSEFLNLTDVNVQIQDDLPFLLYETPGNAARIFNRVVKLDVIDRALAGIGAKKRANTKELGILTKQKEDTEKALEKYIGLAEFELYLIAYENAVLLRTQFTEECSALESILQSIVALQQQISSMYPEKISIIENLVSARELQIKEYHLIGGQVQDLAGLVQIIAQDQQILESANRITKIEEVLFQIQRNLNEKQALTEEEANINLLLKSVNCDAVILSEFRKITSMQMLIKSLEEYINDSGCIGSEITGLREVLDNYQNIKISKIQFGKELAQVKAAMPNVCPLCGSDLKEDICVL